MVKTPVIQFGTSRFLQAHADLFLSEARPARGITVVQTSGDAARGRRLAALAAPGGYPVRIRGFWEGRAVDETRTVTSVKRGLSAASDWAQVVRVFVEEAEFVLSNTGDAGYQPRPGDAAQDYDPAMSFPAKLFHLLAARHAAGGAPLVVMPMELVVDNGRVLKEAVLSVAALRGSDPALVSYIEDGVTWACSLVDRIVAAPLEPAGAVAEPYALWAIQTAPGVVAPAVHPAIEMVDDLAAIERLKLHILNLGHTVLVDIWQRRGGQGDPVVRAFIALPEVEEALAAIYREDMASLGVAPPDIEPLATQHIVPIIAMCEDLMASRHAYAADGHVLFDVASFADYGKLSGRSTDELIAGARIDVAPYKKNPADFVLWKPSTPELPGWDSPWGRGRPGWHIECSAMAATHLGETIDIHAGGVDLVFPHHENEIAQSTCAHGGKTFARFWLHNGMLTFDGAKMSKSVGNVKQLHALLAQHPPEALRYALLSAHYRQPLDWSESLIEQSIATLDRLYGTLRELAPFDAEPEVSDAIDAALEDDLNTPTALAIINQTAASARQILALGPNRIGESE
ncbi:MAG: cysteine--tRNA ligase, partial [Rhizobiales bacterium]|nr:cysteine--tRNA ligase [Hyphomicrobiales bacterium]